ncbi:hypothetical protein GCM10028801_01000 [Nocardioides maradonensis]
MTRIVVAGLGDTGLLTAIHLARHCDLEVVGISSQPGLVSGQELGTRLARPEDWQRDYRIAFERYRALDRVRLRHAEVTGLDLATRTLQARDVGGRDIEEPYDVLVIATGVRNGFWRTPDLRTVDEVTAALATAHARLAGSSTILVVGGGAASVSSALQLALRWPGTRVSLAFPGERGLPQHHPRTWANAARRLEAAGSSCCPVGAPSYRTTRRRSLPAPSPGRPATHRHRPTRSSGRSAAPGPTPPGCRRTSSTRTASSA